MSDIGHGSDAMMARTRLVSPGSQATTSTGLNYLLAEDNDNIRVPFAGGKLAGGIDSAIQENKALEESIARQKRIADMLNKKYIDQAIKNAPEGVLMDPAPRPNYELIEEMLNPKDKGLIPNNTIEFDDGTIFFTLACYV